jgi:tetratricopeptide (TPR) repeat protein
LDEKEAFMSKKKQILLVYLFLAAATLIAFWQVHHFDFNNFDDDTYVTRNSHIQDGVTLQAIRWAFTTGYANFWHPMTWLSHMLDVQLFGLSPGGHHLTNLLFHIANTLLLFFVFHRMTKALWKSAFIAALFALHPLHVESVAWVAERKDVLSAFFWMLTMGAYLFYVERPGMQRYLAVMVFFVLGMMAKPMLVTLPLVMLLLDYWPLRRFEEKKSAPDTRVEVKAPAVAGKRKGKSEKGRAVRGAVKAAEPSAKTEQRGERKYDWALIRFLLREKIPFFVLTVPSSIVAFIVQQEGGAVSTIEGLPLGVRLANAFVTYILYIGKMIWPSNLAVFYPHPGLWPLWQVGGAVLLLLVVTLLVIRGAKRFPYLPVGWLWYVGTLVPVIGLVQVGSQARADRYTYIPLIGLFLIVAWGVPELLRGWRYRKAALGLSAALSLSCLSVVTWIQVGYWQNNFTLFEHTLKVTDRNVIAYNNRGNDHLSLGNYRQAIEDYNKAIEFNPKSPEAYNNRAAAYQNLRNYKQAIEDYSKAIELNPKYAEAYNNRGGAYGILGNYRQAIEDCTKAIELNPKYAEAYNNRGNAHGGLGQYRQAIEDYTKAIELNPGLAEAYNNRGSAYGILGNYKQAIEDCSKAIELNPKHAGAYNSRGNAYGSLGNYKQAIEDFSKAIEFNPKYAAAYNDRGEAYLRLGKHSQAIENCTRAIELNPKYVEAYNNRAVAYGILGNYRQAIEDCTKAIELNPKYVEAYNNRAVAYRSLGNPRQAVEDLKTAATLGSEDAQKSLKSQGISW